MRTVAEQRAAVVAEARTWLGTPWRHRGRVKGVAVDCAQLVIKAYAGAGVIEDFDTGEYPRDWHIHRDEERFLTFVPSFAREIAEADVRPGDLVLCKIGRVYSHGVIVIDWPLGIHAAVNAGQVVLCDLARDAGLVSGPRRYFTHKDW
jgi:cell wall-associated NlpC family hydrolase